MSSYLANIINNSLYTGVSNLAGLLAPYSWELRVDTTASTYLDRLKQELVSWTVGGFIDENTLQVFPKSIMTDLSISRRQNISLQYMELAQFAPVNRVVEPRFYNCKITLPEISFVKRAVSQYGADEEVRLLDTLLKGAIHLKAVKPGFQSTTLVLVNYSYTASASRGTGLRDYTLLLQELLYSPSSSYLSNSLTGNGLDSPPIAVGQTNDFL